MNSALRFRLLNEIAGYYVEQATGEYCKDNSHNSEAHTIKLRKHLAAFAWAGTLKEVIWIESVPNANAKENNKNSRRNQ